MKDFKQIAVLLIVVLLLINLVVFALKLISWVLFWAIIVIVAIIAYSGLIKEKYNLFLSLLPRSDYKRKIYI